MSNHVTCLLLCLSFAALCLPSIALPMAAQTPLAFCGPKPINTLDFTPTASTELPMIKVSVVFGPHADDTWDRTAHFGNIDIEGYWANNPDDQIIIWYQIDLGVEKGVSTLQVNGMALGEGENLVKYSVQYFEIEIGTQDNALSYVMDPVNPPQHQTFTNNAIGADIGFITLDKNTRYLKIHPDPSACFRYDPGAITPTVDVCVMSFRVEGCTL